MGTGEADAESVGLLVLQTPEACDDQAQEDAKNATVRRRA
jgi:hypothetical protein